MKTHFKSFCWLVISMPCFGASCIEETFDAAGSISGFTTQAAILSFVADNGVSSGYMKVTDEGGASYVQLPAPFRGDLSAYDGGTFSFDVKAFQEDTTPGSGTGDVFIVTPGGTLVRKAFTEAPRAWTKYAVPLTAEFWGVTQTEWTAILANVTAIRVNWDVTSDVPDIAGVDNIRLCDGDVSGLEPVSIDIETCVLVLIPTVEGEVYLLQKSEDLSNWLTIEEIVGDGSIVSRAFLTSSPTRQFFRAFRR